MAANSQLYVLRDGDLRQQRQDVVFVHSSFRTSSTWFWLAIRRDSRALAYYEIFNPLLQTLTPASIPTVSSGSWNSRHPQCQPYFEEYRDLLSPEGGVPGYTYTMASRFFPSSERAGPKLDDDQRRYIQSLVEHARNLDRIPVLTCCRTLGRMSAIKQEFGGWHVFLYRNLFRQWMSYLSLFYDGEDYFLKTTALTLRACGDDAFLAALAKEVLTEQPDDPGFGGFKDLAAAFSGFVGLHFYLSIQAFLEADQVVEADRLAIDPRYAAHTQAVLFREAGLRVDLTGAQIATASVGDHPHVPADMTQRVNKLLADVLQHKNVGRSTPCFAFASKLATDMLQDAELYASNTRALHARMTQQLDALKQQLEAMRSSVSWRATKPLRAAGQLLRWINRA